MTWASIADPDHKQMGSEGGVVVVDEEHVDGARITLEREASTSPFAITCGIYGWMVHTRFFDKEGDAQFAFEQMKVGIDSILAVLPDDHLTDEKIKAVARQLSDFVARFP